MRRLHFVVGVVAVIVFLATGQYMDRVHAHLAGMADAPRMLYRSAHIYLLFAALINILLGVYLTRAAGRAARALQLAGSLALLATPVLFLAAFAFEPELTGLIRPWARPAIELSLAGTLAHALAAALSAVAVQPSSRSTSAAGIAEARSAGASSAMVATVSTASDDQA